MCLGVLLSILEARLSLLMERARLILSASSSRGQCKA